MEVVTIYRIGEFSKIVGMTTKTLRYYDDEGILTPSYRNKANGYRLYSPEDIKKAEIVAEMRNFGFTISEMKDALRNIRDDDDFIDYLDEKIIITKGLIERHQQLISKIELYLVSTEQIPIFAAAIKSAKSAQTGAKGYAGFYADSTLQSTWQA